MFLRTSEKKTPYKQPYVRILIIVFLHILQVARFLNSAALATIIFNYKLVSKLSIIKIKYIHSQVYSRVGTQKNFQILNY